MTPYQENKRTNPKRFEGHRHLTTNSNLNSLVPIIKKVVKKTVRERKVNDPKINVY